MSAALQDNAPSRPVWTEPRKDEVKRRWAAGETQLSIARSMGVTVGAVNGQVERMGLPKRKGPEAPRYQAEGRSAGEKPCKVAQYQSRTEARHMEIARLRYLGTSYEAIGEAVGMDPHSVSSLCSMKRWYVGPEHLTEAHRKRTLPRAFVDPELARYQEIVERRCVCCGKVKTMTRFVFRCSRCRSLEGAQ